MGGPTGKNLKYQGAQVDGQSSSSNAEANGQLRLAANHRRVQDSLDRIIPALEGVKEGGNAP